MKKSINAVANKCNSCDNTSCYTTLEPCRGFKPYSQPGFSFLELAIGNSATAVNDLLNNFNLQFIPNDRKRGFDLAKI